MKNTNQKITTYEKIVRHHGGLLLEDDFGKIEFKPYSMQSYINSILDELQGETPKEKFEYLQKIKNERETYWAKAHHAHSNFKALSESPAHENMKSIFSALAKTTNVKCDFHCFDKEELGKDQCENQCMSCEIGAK